MPKERDATAEEMQALAHPLRWRILRLTLDTPLTNKQIAERLGRDPGTVLHHVRLLVKSGFLKADDVRAGKRGALERPYRSTGKSWRLRLLPDSGATATIIDAVREEMIEAGNDSVLYTLRLGVRLNETDVASLNEALRVLGEEYSDRDDPDGQPIGILAVVHKRKT